MDIVYKASDPLDEFYRICDEQGEERRLEARRKIYEEKDFNCVYCLYHEKRSGCMYSEMLFSAWISAENPNSDINVSKSELKQMFSYANPEYLMDDEEREQLDQLDSPVTVYRGVTSHNADNIRALSWTLNYDTAEWFSKRFGEDGTVYDAQIPKEYIYALFNGRNES